MAITRESLRSDVITIAGRFPMFSGDNEIGESNLDLAIDLAMDEFNEDKPKKVVVDLTGDDGNYYPLSTANFPDWEDDFSHILQVDFDAGSRISDDALPDLLSIDDGDVTFYEDNSGVRYVFFPNHAASSSEVYRITHTARYDIDASTQDIPTRYENAVLYKTMEHYLTQVLAHMAKGTDGPVGVEFSVFNNPARIIERAIDRYRDKYNKELGISDGVMAASVEREFDIDYLSGERYIFHSGRTR